MVHDSMYMKKIRNLRVPFSLIERRMKKPGWCLKLESCGELWMEQWWSNILHNLNVINISSSTSILLESLLFLLLYFCTLMQKLHMNTFISVYNGTSTSTSTWVFNRLDCNQPHHNKYNRSGIDVVYLKSHLYRLIKILHCNSILCLSNFNV